MEMARAFADLDDLKSNFQRQFVRSGKVGASKGRLAQLPLSQHTLKQNREDFVPWPVEPQPQDRDQFRRLATEEHPRDWAVLRKDLRSYFAFDSPQFAPCAAIHKAIIPQSQPGDGIAFVLDSVRFS